MCGYPDELVGEAPPNPLVVHTVPYAGELDPLSEPHSLTHDLLLDYSGALDLSLEEVRQPRLQGMSGASIWVATSESSPSGIWSPTSHLRIVAIQSTTRHGSYIRAKRWHLLAPLVEAVNPGSGQRVFDAIVRDSGQRPIDPDFLRAFISGFYGYGDYAAPYWFIGMEEGGCNSFADLEMRIRAWHTRGRQGLEDLVGYHAAIGVTEWFGSSPKLQKTWSGLIRAVLTAQGRRSDNEAVRAFQAEELGRHAGEICMLELLPLPARSIGSWPYMAVGELEYLRNRETYTEKVLPRRLERIVAEAREHRPRAVVCYGLGYQEYWAALSDNAFEERLIEGKKTLVGRAGGALLLVIQHPAAYGVPKAYFEAVGRLMAGGL